MSVAGRNICKLRCFENRFAGSEKKYLMGVCKAPRWVFTVIMGLFAIVAKDVLFWINRIKNSSFFER